jgi:hypothetical protein
MHKGSCLCGAVRYEIAGDLGPIVYCHCSKCRKASGSAFNPVSPVARRDFHLRSGGDAIAKYESSPGVRLAFCRHCGSSLFSERDSMPDVLRLRLGTLDTAVGAKVSAHIFVGSKADWDEILDDAPQYAERPAS